jgi:hypothetical protein
MTERAVGSQKRGDDRERSPYEYATRAMPSSAQVAATKTRNKLSKGEGKVANAYPPSSAARKLEGLLQSRPQQQA